ncbi:M67 family metallopeptidase [Thermococcus alcaliphilus]|uniref:M67 family metallopeptidase n=1 Tax=Thermococcus alcaliphilus TaxID=139207 RepID=UPI00209023EE|nr:M67 family metallopeptidase [Thermococcus alcaliphilus]MCO6041347.1 M67 family metallopeptidase [Thermococcus alcaliphilus]
MRSLFIKRAHLKEILTNARESKVEICGFLIGRMKGEDAFVDYVVFAENRLNSPVGFEIDPLETLKVLEKAEEEEKEVIGIFHSHLNCPPYPSPRDLKGMDLWRNIWLIVNNTGEYRAFVLENGQIKEINVEVI